MNTPNRSFTIVCPQTYTNKVSVIKAIRTLTGLGLKEAKDASEVVGQPQTFELSPQIGSTSTTVEDQFRLLRNEGVEVGEPVYKLLEELRKIGAQALMQGEDEFANEILQLVLAEKLRRAP